MSDVAEERMQNYIDELEQENRLLRARNDRFEKEISELQENGCKFPLCQNEDYQQELAEQIKRELYTGQTVSRKPLHQEHIFEAYRKALGQYVRSQDEVMVLKFARAIEAAHGIEENKCSN
jgi:hypothetical protein